MIQPAIVASAHVNDELITFVLTDGRELAVPTSWSPRLRQASQRQRDHFEIEPDRLIVAWPDLDEHIGVWTLLGVSEDEAMSAAGFAATRVS